MRDVIETGRMVERIVRGLPPEQQRRLARVDEEALPGLRFEFSQAGVVLTAAVLRAAVLVAVTIDRPPGEGGGQIVLGRQLAAITGRHAGGEHRIRNAVSCLVSEDMDDGALAQLAKLASQFRQYATHRVPAWAVLAIAASRDDPQHQARLRRVLGEAFHLAARARA